MSRDPIGDLFNQPTPVPDIEVKPTPPANPSTNQSFSTLLILGLAVWLGYLFWQKSDGEKDHREDRQEQVDPKPPASLEGSRLVFVYEMKTPTADQVEVVGNLAELQKRHGMKERVLLDKDLTDPIVTALIQYAASKNIKPPFMALTKDGKPFKAAPFPETIKHSDIEEFCK